jgi:Mn-dependent DtxR family transcriptional regulator
MTIHRVRICKCGHEEAVHDGNGCHYGYDSVHGKCECDRFRSRKALGKRIEQPTQKPTTAIEALKAAAEFLALAIGLLEKQPEKQKASKLVQSPTPKSIRIRPVGPRSSNSGVRKILIAIAQHRAGVTRDQISILTGYKNSTRNEYLRRLEDLTYIQIDDQNIRVTEAGQIWLGNDFERLPTGNALREHWLGELPEGEASILELVCSSFPRGISREAISSNLSYATSTRNEYIRRLERRKLVLASRDGDVFASKELFP